MANRLQLRRGGAQEWANANPTLAQGELGIELDTGRFKIGDGVSAWNTLRYERPVESTSNTANTLVQRDADGNFAAGTITATVIGNASTAARLASTRQIQISGDLTATGNFDGSQNLNLASSLELIPTLPHYDGTASASGTYTKVTVDSKGRITNASFPSTLADYNLNGTVEGSSAQPYDLDLVAIAGLTTTGMISRTSGGNMATRTITGTPTRISIVNGNGVSGNPTIDLITTAVVPGNYNTESLTSVNAVGSSSEPFGTQTVNAVKFTVDDRGRLTSATNVPIATAVEGTTALDYNAATSYSRYAIIKNASKVYQAYQAISAGAGAPTHTSGDNGGWRYLAAESTEQKGLASFAQEDFDVASGHVSIAAAGVDNTQLQNNRVSFADGNSVEHFELDQELTATTGYRGFTGINYVNVKNTSGGLLFAANNTGDSGNGEVDINVKTLISDPDVVFDGATAQTIDKTGDGNLTIQTTQSSSSARSLSIAATNSGSGTSTVSITAEDVVDIQASDASTGKVHVENMRIQGDHLASTGTLKLDPGDDRAVTGLVQILGNLQVDGTTTTVNSTTTTVDDPVFTLGGDTAPTTDDNKDRGIEFRYYDSQARLGFFGYDDSYADLGGHTGGFAFLYNASQSSAEIFTGTDAGIRAGNLKLTTNTNSTSNTTGDLVVAGGVGIGDDVNIGGLLDVDGTFRANSTSRFDDNIVFQGASKTLELKNGSGTTKTTLHTTTGNVDVGGILTVTGAIDANSSAAISGDVHLESTNDITTAKNGTTGAWEIQSSDYGALRLDGGFYVAGSGLIDGTLHVNGPIEVKDSATETESRLNWLRVRYRGRFGDTYQASPSYASHNFSTIKAHGGAGIMKSLYVGATGSGERFSVGKLNSGDTEKFSVIGASGNTDIQGTLNVEGNTTIQDSVTINASNENFKIQNGSAVDKFTVDTDNGNTVIEGTVNINGVTDVDADFAVRNGTTDKFFVASSTGNTNIEGTLTADGHTELNSTLNVDSNTTIGGTLEVTNNTEINGTLDVDANFAVRSGTTDKMTVASSTGNIATDGTLVVAGQTTINDSLIIQSDNEVVNVNNGSGVNKFSIDTDNGNTNIIGTLTVGDATQINDTFGTSGVNTFTNNTEQTLTGTYAADGAVRLTGGAGIGKNLAVGGGLRVYGGTELSGALDLNSSANISGSTIVENQLIVKADNKFFKVQTAGAVDKFTIDTDNGNTVSQGDLTVAGDVNAQSNLIVTGNLTVNGTTSTVNSTTVTIDDPVFTLGGDTAPASNDGKDRGIEFRYFDGSAKLGFFGFDRSTQEFAFLTTATNSSEVFSGTDAALRIGSLNVTGAGTSVDIDNNLNVDGTATVDGQIISQLPQGTAPFVVASSTKVNNLNADFLDGLTTSATDTTGNSVVTRASGNFSAGQITAATGTGAAAGFLGNASTADAWKTARTLTIDGVVDGSVSINGASDPTLTVTFNDADITALAAQSGTGYMVRTAANTYAHRTFSVTASSGITLTNADGVSGNTTINVASASTNAANNLVLRDGSGNFASNVITATSFSGNLIKSSTSAKDIKPESNSTYDLGSSALQWANIHADAANIDTVTGNLTGNVTGNLVAATTQAKDIDPALNSTYDLGSSSLKWANIHADAASIGTTTGNVTGNLTGNLVAATTEAKDIDPALNSTYDLGSSSLKWANIHADAAAIATTTGNLTGNVTGNLVAATTESKNIVPDLNATYDLGSSTKQWSNIHADAGNIDAITGNLTGNVTGNLLAATTLAKDIKPDANSTYDLGSSTLKWQNIYADAAAIATTTGNVIGNLTGNLLASTTQAKDIKPALNSTYDLGSSSLKWQDIFADAASIGTVTGNVTGNLTGNLEASTTQAKDIDPALNSTYDLGSASLKWQRIFADAATISTTTGNLTGNVTGNLVANTTESANIIPDTNGIYSLGSSTKKYMNVFADAAAITTITGNLTGTATQAANINNHDTDALSEGLNNLYTTAARTRGHFTYGTGIEHDGAGGLAVTQSDINTDNITEGSTNVFFTDTRADARVAAATGANLDLSQKTTTNLAEGTNLYHTEARVQTKLDHAFEQLKAMLNNLATSTTLKLNLSGDPTPGSVVTLGSISSNGVGGYTAGTNVATTASALGTGLTVDTTVNADGAITAIALNQAGTDYVIGETITIPNSNLGGVDTLNLGTLSGGVGGFSAGTGVATTNSGSGDDALTVNTTVDGNGAITNVVINAAGTGYVAGDTITITNPNAGGAATVDTLVGGTGYANGTAIATTTVGSGSGLTLDLTTSNGVVTGVAINGAGSGYAVDDTITIVNANASGVKTLGSIATAGTGYATGTAIATTNDGSGSNFTVDISSVDASGAITAVAINNDGSGYTASDTITIVNANSGGVKTLGTIATGGTGYAAGSAIATTSSGSGTSLTVDLTVDNGVVTGVTINDDGSGYAASEVITIVNANASGIKTVGNFGATDSSRTPGTYTIGTSDYITQASGANATFTVVIGVGGTVDSITVTDDGSGFIVNETITIADAQLGGGGGAALTFDATAIHGNGCTIPVSAIHGNGCTIPVSEIHGNGATIDIATIFTNATVNVATVFTNATFSLSDITTMEIGATLTGTTSNSSGVITAMDSTSVTVDNVSGFFKKGETVGANDVTNLTISSFG
ncbi:fiber [Cyanophage P-RSM3]|uniref:Major tropism determinant N-terminal domain-containing protein n=3 Tax=Ronodorvirus ssm4 TaxID=2845939 RepID=M1NX90_9CAUD|nr:structural protein [Prochlorococcus phage P-SSM4]AAX46888.1 YadA domain-containing structural protein [Prochlorococcus phage P-SSM4]AGF91506.1 hypothetical protein CPYG_00212 [Cyanophage P-SS1]AGH26733.1 fiber [Cyanophage P-RSM3]